MTATPSIIPKHDSTNGRFIVQMGRPLRCKWEVYRITVLVPEVAGVGVSDTLLTYVVAGRRQLCLPPVLCSRRAPFPSDARCVCVLGRSHGSAGYRE